MRTLHLTIAITSAAALQPPTIQRRPRTVRQSQESPYVADYDQPPGPHATKWLATSENNDQWIEFDERHYRSMYADMSRTEMFTQTLEKKLSKFPPKTAVVCDLGTGPYLLFAKAAAAAGARKVYAIEAVPGSQNKAREELAQLEAADNSGVEPGVIELVCGFSTDVELPEKVDILISEIAGSIASEEGVYGLRSASMVFNAPRRWRGVWPSTRLGTPRKSLRELLRRRRGSFRELVCRRRRSFRELVRRRRGSSQKVPRSHDKRRARALRERTKEPRLLRAFQL
jgi:hypothetical protein